MAVYLTDCNGKPIPDAEYIPVAPNAMTSQAYRIIREEIEDYKRKQQEATA